ncbi:unnamed product [Ostreococcus tauri]|uniref:Unnamed product n=1 Tax=Ostreococcus tauri TaxID=70448 RepID=A0A090M678_OSTTA|nr:unnamed product [Ostreococcus tauri]CEF98182.1 unnamed product [Ostreococcus tauri]|eukprot:XP_022839124.1 unnamed product [Ostreococcus tauri]
MADVTDEEIKARGIMALRDLNARQNGARVDAPSLWGWGRNRWSNLVRQELCRRARHGTRRRSDEEAAAFLAALQARGEPRQNPPSEAPAPTPQRVRDDKSPDHPGLQLFEGVFRSWMLAVRVFPFKVSREALERVMSSMGLSERVCLVDLLEDASVVAAPK